MAENFGRKIVPILRMIDPMFTPRVEDRFIALSRYSDDLASEAFQARMGVISHVITKEELGLKPPKYTTLRVRLADEQRYYLETIKENMRTYIEQRHKYYADRETNDVFRFNKYLDTYRTTLDPEDQMDFDVYRQSVEVIRTTFKTQRMAPGLSDDIKQANRYERDKIMPTLKGAQRDEFNELKTIYKYTILKIQGECLAHILGKTRMACYREMALAVDYNDGIRSTTKKTLIFTTYREIVDALTTRFKEQGYHPLAVHGDIKEPVDRLLEDYKSTPKLNPLTATFKSLSTGVTLVVADTMYIVNPPFREYTLTQAISRIHRIGQDSQVHILFVELDTGENYNIASRTIDILKWSQEEVARLLGLSSAYDLKEVGENKVSIEAYDESIDLMAPIPDDLPVMTHLKDW